VRSTHGSVKDVPGHCVKDVMGLNTFCAKGWDTAKPPQEVFGRPPERGIHAKKCPSGAPFRAKIVSL